MKIDPKRFAAVIMRIREPKTTALIFASGKMVVTGAKSEDDSKLASRKYARIIQKLGKAFTVCCMKTLRSRWLIHPNRLQRQVHGLQDPEHCRLLRHQVPDPS